MFLWLSQSKSNDNMLITYFRSRRWHCAVYIAGSILVANLSAATATLTAQEFLQEKGKLNHPSSSVISQAYLKVDLPSALDVSEMVAEMYQHPFDFKDVGPITIPRREYERILKMFRSSHLNVAADLHWPEIGTLKIKDKSGRVFRLCWYWYGGKHKLHFSYQGMRFRANNWEQEFSDSALMLDGILRATLE
jgi:hypothetical protein